MQNISTYNIRIQRNSYSEIRQAIENGDLRRTTEQRSGAGGELWAPTRLVPQPQAASSDHLLQLGRMQIAAPLYRLPGDAYQALLHASEGIYRGYADLSILLDDLRSGCVQPEHQIADLLAQGQELISVPAGPVDWLPAKTRLVEQRGDWLVSLGFTQAVRPGNPCRRHAAGVDVGLNPLATAVIGNTVWQTPVLPVMPTQGSRVSAELAESINYQLAREALEDLTDELIQEASSIVVELLDLTTFTSPFVAAGRAAAVIDWHQAWLPQTAQAAGLPLIRVRPAYTSARCCNCASLNTRRRGDQLTCRGCGMRLNVHENAARNIVRRGRDSPYRRRS